MNLKDILRVIFKNPKPVEYLGLTARSWRRLHATASAAAGGSIKNGQLEREDDLDLLDLLVHAGV